ncbi:acyl-CoA dehydrogenase family protein [Geodermatophilus sp. URMC 64]
MSENRDHLAAFRADVRAWAARHVPSDWEHELHHADGPALLEFERRWLKQLRAGGYAAPHWSREHGGGGFSLAEQVVIFEELSRANAPRLNSFDVALNHVYATLVEGGSPDQQARFFPAILGGQTWCQGFSEPEAGSDLASLRTRAVRSGDHFVVNGQKVWSSGADRSDYCLLLARTDPDAPKRRGLSLLLVDLQSPGVEVRPIKQSTGQAEFAEIFLTDVVVPAENLVGEENDGWAIAQATLSAERGPAVLELVERMNQAAELLVELAAETPLAGGWAVDDVAVREALADFGTRVQILRLLCRKVLTDLVSRGGTGPEASLIKVYYSELLQDLMRFGVDLKGPAGQHRGDKPSSAGYSASGLWMLDYLGSWSWTIGGGTNEIQRTVIAERVLGLPREPRPADATTGRSAR